MKNLIRKCFVLLKNLMRLWQKCYEGNYFWNSGIFMFSAKSMINAFQLYANEILSLVSKSLELSEVDLDLEINPKFWIVWIT